MNTTKNTRWAAGLIHSTFSLIFSLSLASTLFMGSQASAYGEFNVSELEQMNSTKGCTSGTTDSCTPLEFCSVPTGKCTGTGKCLVKPEVCPAVHDPVCGCDGKTYENECYAERIGMNLKSMGPCTQ